MTEQPEPRWISRTVILAIHADQIRQHGGSSGVRDDNLLQSALARAPNRWYYESDTDLAALAATYAFGIAAFLDGNKRTAFQAMYVFLGLNGFRLLATEPEVVAVMVDVATGAIDEASLAAWLRARSEPR